MRAYSTGSKSGSATHPVPILWGPGNGWSIKLPGHPTVQLDQFGGTPVAPGEMDVDWIHVYK